MRSIGSMRFRNSKLGFAVLASAFLAAGVSSVAFGAAHAGTSGSSCYSTCPSLTRLAIAGHVTHFGSEQNVVFNVRVKARVRGTSGTPGGTVTIGVPLDGAVHDHAGQRGEGELLAVTDGPAGPEPQLPGQRRVQRQLGLHPVAFRRQARAGPVLAAQVPGEHRRLGHHPWPGRAIAPAGPWLVHRVSAGRWGGRRERSGLPASPRTESRRRRRRRRRGRPPGSGPPGPPCPSCGTAPPPPVPAG